MLLGLGRGVSWVEVVSQIVISLWNPPVLHTSQNNPEPCARAPAPPGPEHPEPCAGPPPPEALPLVEEGRSAKVWPRPHLVA